MRMLTENIIQPFAMIDTLHSFRFGFALRIAASLVALAMVVPAAAQLSAQAPFSMQEADQAAAQIFQETGVTGMVLAVVRGRESMIKTYGESAPGSGKTPDPSSLLRLCSISKVFTADLLLQLAAEGKVSLTDPLQKYAPHGETVPNGPEGTPITLLDLATHTAGLTREVSSYPRKTPHFTFPDETFRWTWLPEQHLQTEPGTVASYSNVGFDLLGDALASATHESYAQLVHDRLLQPLGMWDTTLSPSPEQCARLLRDAFEEGPCTDTQASGPSGGLYSTPNDMVKFLRYLLHIPGSPAAPASLLSIYMKPKQLKWIQGLDHAGRPTGIGLAWIQLGDPDSASMVMQKTGGGAGFSTYIALNPQKQTGIFAAVTYGRGPENVNFFEESNKLLAGLAGVPPVPAKVHLRRAAHRRIRRRKAATRN